MMRYVTLAFVLFVAAPAYGQSYIDELAKQLPAPFRPGIDKTFLGKEWRGGNLEQHKEYFKALAASGEDVEVRDACWSACTLVLAYIPKEFTGLAGFFGNDTTDMLLRNSTTGGFEVYDISNNLITNAAFLGTVGLDWKVMGFGNFSSRGETDMILRNANNGGVEVYDINNNQLTGAAFIGTVGLDWQFSGIGNFSGAGESDMLLRNANTGGLEVYDIANNQITNAAFIGTVGLDWQFSGVGNFSGNPGETDLLLRNSKTGGLEVYDIANNQLTGAAFIGTVGLTGSRTSGDRRFVSSRAQSLRVPARSERFRSSPRTCGCFRSILSML
jgi:hypothetical protein